MTPFREYCKIVIKGVEVQTLIQKISQIVDGDAIKDTSSPTG